MWEKSINYRCERSGDARLRRQASGSDVGGLLEYCGLIERGVSLGGQRGLWLPLLLPLLQLVLVLVIMMMMLTMINVLLFFYNFILYSFKSIFPILSFSECLVRDRCMRLKLIRQKI